MRLQKNRGKPAIINVNIGTTVRGAVDNLDLVLEALERTGYSEDRFFIHCDGALFGLMVLLSPHNLTEPKKAKVSCQAFVPEYLQVSCSIE